MVYKMDYTSLNTMHIIMIVMIFNYTHCLPIPEELPDSTDSAELELEVVDGPFVNEFLTIKLTSNAPYANDFRCSVTLITETNSEIIDHNQHIELILVYVSNERLAIGQGRFPTPLDESIKQVEVTCKSSASATVTRRFHVKKKFELEVVDGPYVNEVLTIKLTSKAPDADGQKFRCTVTLITETNLEIVDHNQHIELILVYSVSNERLAIGQGRFPTPLDESIKQVDVTCESSASATVTRRFDVNKITEVSRIEKARNTTSQLTIPHSTSFQIPTPQSTISQSTESPTVQIPTLQTPSSHSTISQSTSFQTPAFQTTISLQTNITKITKKDNGKWTSLRFYINILSLFKLISGLICLIIIIKLLLIFKKTVIDFFLKCQPPAVNLTTSSDNDLPNHESAFLNENSKEVALNGEQFDERKCSSALPLLRRTPLTSQFKSESTRVEI